MKSLRNKVVLSAIVLAFALIATIGSTYAWFTVSNTVAVSSIQLNVQSSESLLIRVYDGETGLLADNATEQLLDAATYSANLTYANIIATDYYGASGTGDLAASRLTPVTAAVDNTYAALNAKALKLMDVDSKVLTTTGVNGNSSTGEYVDVKFWLLSQTTTLPVVLDTLSITASNTLGTQDAIVNAVTVAVWESGHSTVAAGAITGFVDTEATSNSYIFSMNPDYGFAFVSGMRGYDGDTTDTLGAQSAVLTALHSLYASTAAVAHVSAATVSGATSVVTLTAGQPTLVNVRIYVEGWDAQTTNAVLAAIFSVSFKFSLKTA